MDVWVIADTNSAIFQLYYGENKVILNEMTRHTRLIGL